jgi:hypothetical protein
MEVSGQLHAPGRFTPGKRAPDAHWRGVWMGPRAGLEAVAKRKILASAGTRTPVVHSVAKSYLLSYPGSTKSLSNVISYPKEPKLNRCVVPKNIS